jgi:hypothetical protein
MYVRMILRVKVKETGRASERIDNKSKLDVYEQGVQVRPEE